MSERIKIPEQDIKQGMENIINNFLHPTPEPKFEPYELTNNICQLDDHKALVCECGSVNFCLLRSGKIECNNCGTHINKRWITHTDIRQEDLPKWHTIGCTNSQVK